MPLFSRSLRRLVRWVPLFLLPVALMACADPPAPPPDPEPVPFTVLGLGQSADLDTTERVLRTAEAWQAVRDSLHPAAPFEAVDFSEHMLLMVANPVSSGGYGIVVETVARTDSSLTAHYLLTEPGDDCAAPPAQVVPFQVVQIPHSNLPVTFERRAAEYPCTRRQLF
jgi:hypothetical protein